MTCGTVQASSTAHARKAMSYTQATPVVHPCMHRKPGTGQEHTINGSEQGPNRGLTALTDSHTH